MAERIGKSYELWWGVIGDSSTAETNRRYIEGFLSWIEWTYDELFNKCLEARRSPDPRDMALFTSKLVKYYHEVRKRLRHYGDKELSPGTSRNHIKAVTSYLQTNGLRIEFSRQQTKEMSSYATRVKDNLTKEEIQTLLKATTNIRNHAIILSLKDSGMAVSDLADLNVGDISKALDNGDKFTSIEYRRNKTDVSGTPCFGPESLEAIRSWMRWRRDRGFPCDPDTPLFIITEARNPDSYSKEDVKKGLRLSGRAMTSELLLIVRRSGVSESKRLSAHSFRIFNQSSLESAGVNKNLVYRIQARVIPDSGRVYSKGEVLTSYQKAYDSLAVLGTKVVQIENERVAGLEAKQAASEVKQMETDAKLDQALAALHKLYEQNKPKT
jgi:integrase